MSLAATPPDSARRLARLASVVLAGLAAPIAHPALGLAPLLPLLAPPVLESAPEWKAVGLGSTVAPDEQADAVLLAMCTRLGAWHRWPRFPTEQQTCLRDALVLLEERGRIAVLQRFVERCAPELLSLLARPGTQMQAWPLVCPRPLLGDGGPSGLLHLTLGAAAVPSLQRRAARTVPAGAGGAGGDGSAWGHAGPRGGAR